MRPGDFRRWQYRDCVTNLVAAFDVREVPKAIEKAVVLQMIPPIVGVAAPDPAPKQNPGVVEDRLDLTGDVLSQFVEYAAALGIAEQDITGSIFSGDFVPDPNDLRLVLLRLGCRLRCGLRRYR